MDLFKVKQKPMASTAVGFIYIPFCVLASIAIESGESLTRSAQSSLSVHQVRDAKVTWHISLTVSRIYAPRDGPGGPKLRQKGFFKPTHLP